jgi:hypothetical protein
MWMYSVPLQIHLLSPLVRWFVCENILTWSRTRAFNITLPFSRNEQVSLLWTDRPSFLVSEIHNRVWVNRRFPAFSSRLRLKCDGTRAENRFRLSAKLTSPFKSARASVQLTTGSRGVRISSSNAGYTMFRGSAKSTGYPLHSPVSPSLLPPPSCVIVCHHISTGIYRVPLFLKGPPVSANPFFNIIWSPGPFKAQRFNLELLQTRYLLHLELFH